MVINTTQLDYTGLATECIKSSILGDSYIPFHNAEGFEMFYNTRWSLTWPGIVRRALVDAGFFPGIPSGVLCGFLLQHDGKDGNIYGRVVSPDANATNINWNTTAINTAAMAIERHAPVLEKFLVFLPLILVVLVSLLCCCCKRQRTAPPPRSRSTNPGDVAMSPIDSQHRPRKSRTSSTTPSSPSTLVSKTGTTKSEPSTVV